MLSCRKFYFKLLNFNIKFFIKSKVIPFDSLSDLRLDITRPILYILPYYSQIDFLTFRNICLSHNLPDPFEDNKINSAILPRIVFIKEGKCLLRYKLQQQKSVKLLQKYLELYLNNSLFDIQIIPVLVMFNRSPYCSFYKNLPPYQVLLIFFQKIFAVFFLGRDSFVLFSKIISLRDIMDQYGASPSIVQKLLRLARIYFSRQILSAVGPIPPDHHDLFSKMLSSNEMKKAIEDESRGKKISHEQAKKKAIKLMAEIASNFTYIAVRLSDRVLGWMWNFLYQGINVHNVERVRKLVQKGHGIVYVPCHRSHMDYLLLSYVLYHQGLVPPHIAAGINLNFWPAGPIFRRLGAFFMRRSFKGNKLYTTVFREYLSELFNRGHSVEYFMEGGRSRTGRLLSPKTGILSMTIQAILRGVKRPITLIPVYIGYEHVIEVATYVKELRGASKEKENLVQMFFGLSKLRNLGQSYVNFGEPININNWLNQHVPEWKSSINSIEVHRPHWLTPMVNTIANTVMININKSAAINAMNLCSTALLAAPQNVLTRKQLLEQLECYLQLLRNAPYAADSTIPYQTSEELLRNALNMGKFKLEQDQFSDRIILSPEQAILITYYNNNIQHMLALPSLIANIVIHHHSRISRTQLFCRVKLLYPMIKEEWFLHYEISTLFKVLESIVTELCRQQLIFAEGDYIVINTDRIFILQLLAFSMSETIQRYAIAFFILRANPKISRNALEQSSCIMAQRLSALHFIDAPKFFDKSVFVKLISILRSSGYIYDSRDTFPEHIIEIYHLLLEMVSPEIKKYFSKKN